MGFGFTCLFWAIGGLSGSWWFGCLFQGCSGGLMVTSGAGDLPFGFWVLMVVVFKGLLWVYGAGSGGFRFSG